jgi:hypothetical protein
MKLSKIVKIVLIVFAVFYVLRSPGSAAGTLRAAGETAYQSVLFIADKSACFFEQLRGHPCDADRKLWRA